MAVDPGAASPLPAALRWLGPPLALAYGLGSRLDRAITHSRWAPVATLCVGNLTAGGTGKSPAVRYLAAELCRRGRRPAVLMRGYREQGSDEARETEDALKEFSVPVLVGGDRLASAARARELGRDTVLLDDGFQHWRLRRDLDIVLVDAVDPFRGGRLLPWGWLREKPDALRRAGAILATRSDSLGSAAREALRDNIKAIAPQAVVAMARHAPVGLRTLHDGTVQPPESLAGRAILGACGLGQPAAFQRTLRSLKGDLRGFVSFPDHHAFTVDDCRRLNDQARNAGAEMIVVTAKDAAKLAQLPRAETVAMRVLEIRFDVTEGAAELWQCIEAALSRADARVAETGGTNAGIFK